MPFAQSIKTCLRKYAVFSGRATRPEYWWWVLVVIVACLVLSFIDGFIGFLVSPGEPSPTSTLGFLQFIFALATLLPGLAVTVRRLHDIGKTGWWLLPWYGILFFGWVHFAAGLGIFLFAILSAGAGEFDLGGFVEGNFGTGGDVGLILFGLFALLAGILLAIAVTLGVLIWFIVWLTRPGQPGPNPYGPDPRALGLRPLTGNKRLFPRRFLISALSPVHPAQGVWGMHRPA